MGELFVLNESDTLADAVLNDFTINEDIYAGYVMANVEWDSIAVTAGLRVEHTKLDNVGFRLENEVNVVPVSQSDSYTEWLPTAIVRIKPSDDVVVRLAYTRSVGRPEYADLSPGGSLGFEDIGNGQFEGFLSLGNAGLKPYTANSLDAVAEWYFCARWHGVVRCICQICEKPDFRICQCSGKCRIWWQQLCAVGNQPAAKCR